MKNKTLILPMLMLIVLLFTGCSTTSNKNDTKANEKDETTSSIETEEVKENKEEKEEKDKISKQIEAMSLKEKIGQLLIVGFEGQSINEEISSFIKDYKVGGVIFFDRNIADAEQTFKLVNDIKEKNQNNKIPLFVSIDEEGGRVSRVPDEFQKLPSAKIIGNIDNDEVSLEYGKIIGESLNSLGFNLDYAPVLDINSNPDNPVIGDRAFGDTEEIVSRNGIDFSKGLKEKNIIPVAKHFPGHGDTKVDSHVNLPIIYKTREQLEELELMPFRKAIKEEIGGVMVAHILFDQIDKKYPATMSKSIMTDILREDLSFDGVVFSDDMTMGAIIENYSIEEASVKFLEAGGDILLICHGKENPKLIFDSIEKAVRENVITEEEIDKKVYRILKLKEKYSLDDEISTEFDIEELNKKIDGFLEKVANSN